jgi:glucosamine 6-phosphate synthetase-like amidotransferase/phosphosugar isomerase protein
VASESSRQAWRSSRVWREAVLIPDVLVEVAAELEREQNVTELLHGARRIVATGNGAAYYAALTVWTAALQFPSDAVDVVAVPAGVLATDHFRWRTGDVPLVFSSSGELRDVVGLLPAGFPAYALVTASPASTLARQATARIVVPVRSQDAVTHTQAYTGNVLAGLLAWSRATDRDLNFRVDDVPAVVERNLRTAQSWVERLSLPDDVPAAISFGSGSAWPAALETALLLKEVAGVPTEGMETREGATSGMYALRGDHLVVSLPTRDDKRIDEAERICASTGASLVRLPGGEEHTAVLAPITTFPAALALATKLGTTAGLDVDDPPWTAAYYATARTTGGVSA